MLSWTLWSSCRDVMASDNLFTFAKHWNDAIFALCMITLSRARSAKLSAAERSVSELQCANQNEDDRTVHHGCVSERQKTVHCWAEIFLNEKRNSEVILAVHSNSAIISKCCASFQDSIVQNGQSARVIRNYSIEMTQHACTSYRRKVWISPNRNMTSMAVF